MTEEVEIRDISDFPGYGVSRDGRVWSRWTFAGTVSDRWLALKPQTTRTGHQVVTFHRQGRLFTKTIHRLVLKAFIGPCPAGMVACHNDGDPANNRVENLRWDTMRSNMADKRIHGTHLQGSRVPGAKITDEVAAEMRQLRLQGVPVKDIAARFGLHGAQVSRITTGRYWGHVDAATVKPKKLGRIDPADIPEVLRLRGEGLLQREIAERFGVDDSTISRLLARLAKKTAS